MGCSWVRPGLLMTSKKIDRASTGTIFWTAPGCSWEARDLRKHTAPRRERYWAARLDGSDILTQKMHGASPRRERYFEGPGLLSGPGRYFEIAPFWTLLSRGAWATTTVRAVLTQGLKPPALEGWFSLSRTPESVRTTEVPT